MPSDEAGETSPQAWAAAGHRAGGDDDDGDGYAEPFEGLYQPPRQHQGSPRGAARQERLLERASPRAATNWPRARPWPRDSY
ncbi:CACB3 protein, partial [Nothoprocta pentlandii]|nr:CACB3 protein [Nothoprocta pentlandii]